MLGLAALIETVLDRKIPVAVIATLMAIQQTNQAGAVPTSARHASNWTMTLK